MASLDPLSLELRAPVAARSLPDDGVLLNMRRALVALGGGDGENADADGHLPSTSTTADASIVSALAAGELRREIQLWERMMYKSASQHRRALHFQRMRGVTRRLREVAALDVGGAAAALRAGLDAGVSEDARAAALASPAVAAGAHAIWKLPSRALWDDLSRRLLAAARVAAETDEALLAAATSLSGQLAHTFFMPFALVAVASIARLRTCLHQLIVDVVSTYNILTPLLGGGNMPPPGLLGDSADAGRAPESLRCEWSTVTPRRPRPAQTRHERTPRGKRDGRKCVSSSSKRTPWVVSTTRTGTGDFCVGRRRAERRRPRRLRTRKRRGSTGRAAKTSARRCLGACGDSRPR